MGTEFVPPWMESRNCWVVTTFTETVEGEIVTLIFVTGSVQVDVVVLVELVAVVVVHTIAVLAGAAPQEVRVKRAMSTIKNTRWFAASILDFRDSQPIRFRFNLGPQNVKSRFRSRGSREPSKFGNPCDATALQIAGASALLL
jgi:hypothetical protein